MPSPSFKYGAGISSASARQPHSDWKRPPQARLRPAILAHVWSRRRGGHLQSRTTITAVGEIGPYIRITPNQLSTPKARVSHERECGPPPSIVSGMWLTIASAASAMGEVDMSGRPQRVGSYHPNQSHTALLPWGYGNRATGSSLCFTDRRSTVWVMA